MSNSNGSMNQIPPHGDKTRVRQSANRASYDRDSLYAVLDACNIGHVSFMHNDWPQSVPTAIARVEDDLYVHGHAKSRLYRALADAQRVCISACRVDGLVKARSAFHCSMNYRSAVVFGSGSLVPDDEKAELLDAFTDHLIPGSLDDFRPYLAKELKATALIRIPLNDFSVKIRNGDPVDDKEDLSLPHWAGVIPIESHYGAAIPSSDLHETVVEPFQMPDGLKP